MSLETLLMVILLAVGYWLIRQQITHLVQRFGKQKQVAESRIEYITGVLQISLAVVAIILLGVVIGFNYRDVGLFFGSVIALLGVALFAQWSILSNVTASVMVFFFFPYRVGDVIRVLDGENSIEGKLKEVTLFHVILVDDEHEVFTFPNALIFQKAVHIKSGANEYRNAKFQERKPQEPKAQEMPAGGVADQPSPDSNRE